MPACGHNLIVQHEATGLRFFAARCKCWECDNCSKYRVASLRKQIISGEPDTFITLTPKFSDSDYPIDIARKMKSAWNKLVKRIKRLKKVKRLPYFVVMEKTKRGYPHFHILLRAPFIKQAWLSDQWKDLTGAFVVDIRRIKSVHQAARYVTKYITKAPAKFGALKRYWKSKGWRTMAKSKKKKDWRGAPMRVLHGVSVATYITLLKQEGYTITSAENGEVVALKPKSGADPPLWDCGREPEKMPRRRSKGSAVT